MEKEEPKSRILMFPWLAHGHIFPFLELAKRLSTTRNFHIYLTTTSINLDSIKKSIKKHSSSIELVELHIPPLPELPPELHTTKNLPSHLLPTLLQAFQTSSSSFTQILESLKPDLLIYDFFQPWAPKLALSKGVPSVYFGTSGATPFAFYHHLYTEGTSDTFPYPAIYLLDHEAVNLRERIEANIKDADKDFAWGTLRLSSDVVLMKSCREVEGKYMDYLSVLSKKRIVPTGPLVVHVDDDDDEGNSEILKWLSGKNLFSTVYISFGSEYFLSEDEIEEIARGLQLCKANFIWIIRFPLGEKNVNIEDRLPAWFLDVVEERGMVVTGWAPQTKILAHPSIGGFVSHCGWSSITESMYFGVPIIAMPMKVEQPLNSRMVVEAGVAVEVEKKGDRHRYVGEEVAKALNKVFVEKAFYEGMRDRAKKLSEKIKETEEQELNEAAEELMRLCMKK